MDIVFGDCLDLGGHCYSLLLVDVAKIYCVIYGISSLSSTYSTLDLETFKSDAGDLPRRFHSDFDRKFIGGKDLRWIIVNNSNITADPDSRQSSKVLSKRTWRTLIQNFRASITKNQTGREFWYFAVCHAAIIINQVHGDLGLKISTPFELVHNNKPNSKKWFEIFSIGYFNSTVDNTKRRYKL